LKKPHSAATKKIRRTLGWYVALVMILLLASYGLSFKKECTRYEKLSYLPDIDVCVE